MTKDARVLQQREDTKLPTQGKEGLNPKVIGKQRQEASEVMQYWFLLDRDVVKSLAKGNYKL